MSFLLNFRLLVAHLLIINAVLSLAVVDVVPLVGVLDPGIDNGALGVAG